MSPFQLSLTYGSCCHHWFRIVIHYVNGIHFISKRHHIYKDKTDDNRFYYLMAHSLTHLLKRGSLNIIYLYTISQDIPMCTS